VSDEEISSAAYLQIMAVSAAMDLIERPLIIMRSVASMPAPGLPSQVVEFCKEAEAFVDRIKALADSLEARRRGDGRPQ
jgi:hypothetical protein